ncbi:unnamed protein product [Phytophthora fragariaefolia]|uniref:Unnamed protein product n=1 Tax=Phytophthora fragariaefolia TaxID=1490495 RepID=A0A9W7D721_9STRA|nr:unnamed protein product [Phytophthora fragariaefolia]
MLSGALRSASKLQRAAGASRAFAAAAKPFDPDTYEQKYLAKTYNPDGVRGEAGLLFTHGKGSKLYDERGREFLDFYAGIAVSGLGHGDEDWYQSLVANGKVRGGFNHKRNEKCGAKLP